MHHLKEAVIDGVKFVLIPEKLHDDLAELLKALVEVVPPKSFLIDQWVLQLQADWKTYDPEIDL